MSPFVCLLFYYVYFARSTQIANKLMQVCTLNYTKTEILQLSLHGHSLLCWTGWISDLQEVLKWIGIYVCLKYEDCIVESIKKGEVFI